MLCKVDCWQIEREAHGKIDAKLECSTLIQATMDKHDAIPALGYSEIAQFILLSPWSYVHSCGKVEALGVTKKQSYCYR